MLYLDFDYSEDEQGFGTLEAMAATRPDQVVAVHREIQQVLDWAHRTFPGMRAPLDEGGEWDFHLQGQQEWAAAEEIHYDAESRALHVQLGSRGPARHTVTLSLTGTPQFCDAFRQQFLQD
ncbi:hypothetical protein [Rhodoferax sp.]|uniref:hypothetical protein n=1 Tax=Rhodoferax sp. TaxID=50421 RepID=UPI00374D29DA